VRTEVERPWGGRASYLERIVVRGARDERGSTTPRDATGGSRGGGEAGGSRRAAAGAEEGRAGELGVHDVEAGRAWESGAAFRTSTRARESARARASSGEQTLMLADETWGVVVIVIR
jgi:hypothetical protein